MLSFKQFIIEEKSSVPYGVIFKGDKVSFVGRNHGKELKVTDDLHDKIKKIGDEYGYWYEGDSGDVSTTTGFTNKSTYEGSWDDEFIKTVKGYPPQFLYTIFANTNVNGQKKNIPNKNKSIFDSIMSLQSKIAYLKDRKFDSNTLTKFLKMCNEKDIDFVKMSKLPATQENVNKFLDKGESLSWPKNWKDYPNNAGKVAKWVDDERNKFLLSRESGVYFAGSGHLIELLKLDKSLKMIGGEKADQ